MLGMNFYDDVEVFFTAMAIFMLCIGIIRIGHDVFPS